MLRSCSLEILRDMVTMAIEVVCFHHCWRFFLLCWRVIIADFWRIQWAVSAQSSLGGVRGTGRCQSQQGSQVSSPCSPWHSQYPNFWAECTYKTDPLPSGRPSHETLRLVWKVVRLTGKVAKSWTFSQVFCHRLRKKPQSVVDSTGSGCLCGVNQ